MKTTIKVVATICIMLIFFWFWPIRLFTKKNNCYFYTLENLIRYGGRCKWYQSRWWWGYHVSYIKDGYEYHYDMTREERKQIKGFPFFYYGRVRKVKYSMKQCIECKTELGHNDFCPNCRVRR